MCVEYHYTAREAMQRLGMPRSSFYYLVQTGQISQIKLPLRKQAIYPKDEIDAIAKERERILTRRSRPDSSLMFVEPTPADLDAMYELSSTFPASSTPRQGTRVWYRNATDEGVGNPEALHVLKERDSGYLLGGIAMSPLSVESMAALIIHPMGDGPKNDDFLPYDPTQFQPIDVYALDIAVRPGTTQPFIGMHLLRNMLRFCESLMDRGVIIRNIYTVAETEQVADFLEKLGFRVIGLPPEIPEWMHNTSKVLRRYQLDLLTIRSKRKLLQSYQRKYRNLQRRLRRYGAAGTQITKSRRLIEDDQQS